MADVEGQKNVKQLDTGKRIQSAPHSKDSEMMVLGSMLTKFNSLTIAGEALYPEEFYYKEHQIIFEVLKGMYSEERPADIHLVVEELKRQNRLEEIGGVPYLTQLAQYAGTAAYIEEYVRLIRDKSVLRGMIRAAQEIEEEALAEPQKVGEALDEAQAKLFSISQRHQRGKTHLLRDLIQGANSASGQSYLKELEQRQELFLEKGEEAFAYTGLPTGFCDLDKVISGLGASNLIICAARPAMGKTAFALNIAENICFDQGHPVGIFSLEMSEDQLLHRMICSQGEVESQKVMTGSLDGREYQRVVSAIHKMKDSLMVIDDQPGLKVTELRARARRMKETYDIQLLVVDYLQLLSGSLRYGNQESRQQEISEISRMLKNLARELDIPILCLSQLSRKVEERVGHRPMMSDLRESGAIEQDADVVMFLLRREYYDPYDKPGLGEVIVGKNRHGAIGNIDVCYRKEIAQFANYQQGD
ncbi:MAG: replicative DNA helicase [Chlamydiota bacterium]|nr:replicative DNA helicase [Chlamydiota bacterium]